MKPHPLAFPFPLRHRMYSAKHPVKQCRTSQRRRTRKSPWPGANVRKIKLVGIQFVLNVRVRKQASRSKRRTSKRLASASRFAIFTAARFIKTDLLTASNGFDRLRAAINSFDGTPSKRDYVESAAAISDSRAHLGGEQILDELGIEKRRVIGFRFLRQKRLLPLFQ